MSVLCLVFFSESIGAHSSFLRSFLFNAVMGMCLIYFPSHHCFCNSGDYFYGVKWHSEIYHVCFSSTKCWCGNNWEGWKILFQVNM